MNVLGWLLLAASVFFAGYEIYKLIVDVRNKKNKNKKE